jgi:hypothetical protein
MPCNDEKNCQLVDVNTKRLQWQEGKISLQGTDFNKVFLLLESPPL